MGIGPENLEICSSYAREYALPWEGLLVELTTARIQGSTLPGLEDRLKTFGTLWKPGSGPLNIP